MSNERERAIEEAAIVFLHESNPHYAEEAGPEVFHWMAQFHLSRLAADRTGAVRRAFDALLDKFVGCDFHGYEDIADQIQSVLAEMMEAK